MEYIAPEGTEAKVIPVERMSGFALYSKSLGHTFGMRRNTWDEIKAAADKENIRLASYKLNK